MDGLSVTVVTSGAELSTVTDAEPEPVSPSASVAVAVHEMVSSAELVDVLSVTDAPDPRLVPSVALVQA